jgi:anti-sigma factor RsiW
MKTCREIEPDLGAYHDGELAPEEAARIADHLRGCEACQRKRRLLDVVSLAVRSLEPEPVTARLEALLAAVPERRVGTPARVWWRLAAGALLAAAAWMAVSVARLGDMVPEAAPPQIAEDCGRVDGACRLEGACASALDCGPELAPSPIGGL